MNLLDSVFAPLQQLTAAEILINILLAFVLGILVALVYQLTSRHQAINRSFLLTMVILSMVVALVMMVIGNSIARAFSLVGALSIIRFRTVVKENRDIAFVFFALAAGMAAGVGNYFLALYGVGAILVLLLLLDFIEFGAARRGVFLLRLQIVTGEVDDQRISATMNRLFTTHRRLSVRTVRMGQFIEHSYLIRLRSGISEERVINELSALEGMERVNLIADENEAEF